MTSNEFAHPQPRSSGRRLRGSLTARLAGDILSGRYAPGERLGSEADFHRTLDVSRGAYREAVKILTAKGLVESRPCAGTRILPRNRWNLLDPDILKWAFSGGHLPAQFIQELQELRLIVEPRAARLAAERVSSSELDTLSKCLGAIANAGSEEERSARVLFHEIVMRATRNDALVSLTTGAPIVMLEKLQPNFSPYRRAARTERYRAVLESLLKRCGTAAETAMFLLLDDDRAAAISTECTGTCPAGAASAIAN